jgi:phage terminase large subunit-like protein
MSSTHAGRLPAGVQSPRVALVPRAADSEVDDAAFLASSYGLTPDEWQETILEGWLGKRADGRWSSPRCGLAVPRQNGKNGVLEIRELHGLVVLGERFLHTAHEVKTARKAFMRLLSFFDNERHFPELREMVKEIRKTNGQEAVTLHNGGSVEFVARSKGSGRGFSVDVLVLDEAQELSEDALAALLPTISASDNPQTILTGTPPGPASVGEVFTRMRNAGLEGKDARLCWHEWSCEGEVDHDDRRLWAAANPALGIRLRHDTVSDERAAMDEETFGRERLGMWAKAGGATVIDMALWKHLGQIGSQVEDEPVAFALDISPDRSTSSIAVAGRCSDGTPQVEVVDNRRGTGWLVDRMQGLKERRNPIVILLDPSGPAGSLIPALAERGIEVEQVSGREMAQACGAFYDAVLESATLAGEEPRAPRIRHTDQPVLQAALAGARQRPLSDAWAWNRKTASSDITPLVAVTLALHGLTAYGQRVPNYDVLASVW